MQKRDNARALTRLDSLVCLKQVTIMIVMVVMVVMIMPTLPQLLEDDSSMLTSHALWVMGTACRHEPDVQVLLLLLLLLLLLPPPSTPHPLQLRMNELGITSSLVSLLPPSLASASAAPSGAGARVAAKLL